MRQCGAEGVVSALHHIAPGAVWSQAEITARQNQVSSFPDGSPSGLAWDVIESLPVSETIKTKGPDYDAHIANYIESLRNIAVCGIEVVCYNFMPILDWTRTDLRRPMDHGGNAMSFNLIDFVAFDLHILKRATAADDYSADTLAKAAARFSELGAAGALQLQNNIIAGLPGANDTWSLQQVRDNLATYANIDADRLYANMIDFMAQVAPVAQELGIRLCCHPDDPPFPLLGLPRIMSTQADYARLIADVDLDANGITFCTGSLGVDPAFDGPTFIRDLGHRIHFIHLRNTTREAPNDGNRTSFHEASHLEGDTDMVAVIQALLAEESKRRGAGRSDHSIPMRPDHGQDILDDLTRNGMPGYPLIGRMRGLAELRGIIAATLHGTA
jgi:mannonate dehydratase